MNKQTQNPIGEIAENPFFKWELMLPVEERKFFRSAVLNFKANQIETCSAYWSEQIAALEKSHKESKASAESYSKLADLLTDVADLLDGIVLSDSLCVRDGEDTDKDVARKAEAIEKRLMAVIQNPAAGERVVDACRALLFQIYAQTLRNLFDL